MRSILNKIISKRTIYSLLTFKSFFFVLIIFLFIYGPPLSILPVNISLLMGMFFLIFINKYYQYIKIFKIEIFILLCICIYSFLISSTTSNFNFSNVLLNTPFIILFFNLPTIFCLYYFLSKNYPNIKIYDKLINILILISIISSLISILLWFSPNLNDIMKFEIQKYSRELLIYQNHRGFGFSDELLFTFSIVQVGILLLVIEKYGINLYISGYLFLIILSISLNARIGFVFLIIIFILPSFFKKGTFFLFFLFISIFIFFYDLEIELLNFFVSQFIYFIDDLTGKSDVSSFSYLIEEMLFLPSDISEIIFGTGNNIFFESSDSGYVILIFYGGIIYLFTIFYFYFYCFYRGLKIGKFFVSVILFSLFLIANLKGLFFAPKPGMHFFLIVYVFLILSQQKIKTNTKGGNK